MMWVVRFSVFESQHMEIVSHYLKNAQPIDSVHVQDRAFHYGDGCFSTARIRGSQIELYDRHMQRLQLACQKLYLSVDLNLVTESLLQLKQQYGVLNGTLKIIISRGEGQRGYRMPNHQADLWCVYTPQPIQDHQFSLIHAGQLSQQLGLCMPQLVGIKSLNRLEQVILRHELDHTPWDEALVSDIHGRIVEGVSSNYFIRINNQWITPQLGYNGVHGVMRAELLARMKSQGVVCQVRDVFSADCTNIQGLFFCNALHAMQIATRLNDQELDQSHCVELFHQLHLSQLH